MTQAGESTEQQLLDYAARQATALETIRKVLVGLAWALAAVVFLAVVVGYVAAVA
jgi:hypothetical protein